ncbi:class I adenylate-forming enzyme family protein [Xenophilus aerolatus]|nr:AMP-binding protein [Xenophilus aerolatus]
MRIADYLDTTASRSPALEALVFGDVRMSYAQVQAYAHAIAHALRRTPGLQVGSHVGIFSPNDHRVQLVQLGINRADMAWAPLHDRNAVATNAQLADYLDCEAMFFHSVHEAAVAQLKTGLPRVRAWVCLDANSSHGPSLEAWLEGAWQPFGFEVPDLERRAGLYPTGGTTGVSKGVIHSLRSLAFITMTLIDAWALGRGTRLLTVAPLSHAAGTLAMSIIPNGGVNVIHSGFDAQAVLETIAAERITHLFLPPTALYALMAHPAASGTDFTSLRSMVIGAAPVAPAKFLQAIALFGPVMYEVYAQTETGMPVLSKTPADYLRPDGTVDEDVVRSAGRAGPFMRVEIVDEEGQPVPTGQRGEIATRSSMLMSGYYKLENETSAVRRNGFHLTGDIGVMDARGYVTVVDRKKDMIVTGGFNVYPAEVESALYAHEDIVDCIVIGIPDEKWGEAVHALVQLKPGRTRGPEEFVEFCKERIGSLKSPKVVEIVAALPRSPVGKLLRREARARYWEGHWRSV